MPATGKGDVTIKTQGDFQQLLEGPRRPDEYPAWRTAMEKWRTDERRRLGYDPARATEYERPELLWTQRAFIQPQMMAEDRFFYDPVKRKYTVDRYLNDLKIRYGGIDSVLIWPTYPNIGIDDRNQHDLLRDMPGGYDGLRRMVADFHKRGVRVLFPIMPWDNGTRDEGTPLPEALAQSMAKVGADGMNGDTLNSIPRAYRDASDATGHRLAFEPENGMQGDGGKSITWTNMNWGYWWNYTGLPGVSRYKWIEPRHLTHVTNRWAHNHTDDLQYAFFNGEGFESWENVWGIWNGLSPEEAEALRHISAIYRLVPDMLHTTNWFPHIPLEPISGVCGSVFVRGNDILCLLVNRSNESARDVRFLVNVPKPVRIFDLWNGTELHRIKVDLEPWGYAAVLITPDTPSPAVLAHCTMMRVLAKKAKQALETKERARAKKRLPYSRWTWKPLQQQIVPIPPSRPSRNLPEGMVRIPGGTFRFAVSGVEIEKSEGVDVQYPWEEAPGLQHDHALAIKPFYIDRSPVTNAEFKRFVDAAQYHPADDHNFLRDWKDGIYPEGWANRPVTWISIEDARAYAKWAGKRLPHEWEWQYAAQGTDGRAYPWGNEWKAEAVPPPDKTRTRRPPTDVGAYPKGASVFGVQDLVGNVWQWTEEFQDTHTRAAILRGGSYYQPQGSGWYFPQAYRLDQHGKYLLLAPCKDRAGTVGFRCVKEAAE